MLSKEYELASELRTVVTRLIKKLRKESITGQQWSLTERSVMSQLFQHGQLMPSELASAEKITNQSMSQILNKLSDLGYIKRTTSDTDKRKVLVSLTEAGSHIIPQVRTERDAWLTKAIAAKLTPHEKGLLREIIGPLTKLLEFE